ncbi:MULTISPECIES: universal stress protein [Streptomyces]|uniref:Universal stress protein n=1 Tax=Streptomyces lycii TaxID=2654337 RepID=A0ABQ7FBG3_9ACTN|nr:MULTISPECIES: universal stress protein [Streptomyces]KAF4405313.1 universal stress protein [Streptomyces lycii]PGH47169.1 stress-inducible protein [Streptomyces sp. Ru87]
MSRPVTLGLDGSRESLTAADWAAREALLRGLPLRIVHVWQALGYPQPPLIDLPTQRHFAERILREATAELRDRYPELDITAQQLSGRPAEILSNVADDADMLVLGSRGLGALTGFLLSSVALATVAHTDRPIVLVRAGEQAGEERRPVSSGDMPASAPYRDVVLGLDLSGPCDALIEFAFDAAARRAARLRVVHGWSLPPAYRNDPGALDPDRTVKLTTEEANRLSDALRPWRDKFPGVEIVEQAVIGRPARHLVEASSDASLMVVGRRTRRTPVGRRIGAVTHAVMHHCAVPVAVVPHD